jgi:hypothetical protein
MQIVKDEFVGRARGEGKAGAERKWWEVRSMKAGERERGEVGNGQKKKGSGDGYRG